MFGLKNTRLKGPKFTYFFYIFIEIKKKLSSYSFYSIAVQKL